METPGFAESLPVQSDILPAPAVVDAEHFVVVAETGLIRQPRSGQRDRVFMITGTGVHDRPDWPFTIAGIRSA
jgi:hypothetical protein